MHKTTQTILPEHDLHHVLTSLMVAHMNVLPVWDKPDGHVIGGVTQVDVTRAYDLAVDARLRMQRREQTAA